MEITLELLRCHNDKVTAVLSHAPFNVTFIQTRENNISFGFCKKFDRCAGTSQVILCMFSKA